MTAQHSRAAWNQYGRRIRVHGYKPLTQLRKTAIREVAKAIGLPEKMYSRPPFPDPALAARIIGEIMPRRVEIVRNAPKNR